MTYSFPGQGHDICCIRNSTYVLPMATNLFDHDAVPDSEEDLFRIEKPKFSLASVLINHTELSMNEDPDTYLQTQQKRLQAHIQSILASRDVKDQVVETPTALDRIIEQLRTYDIDLASSTEVDKLMTRIQSIYASTPAPSPGKQTSPRLSEGDGFTQRSSEFDCSNLLATINTTLDSVLADHCIIPAPKTTNPLLSTNGTVLLQSCPSSPASAIEEPTYIAVHRLLFSSQSHAFFVHAQSHRTTKVFAVDADKYTLSRFVQWLYHPRKYNINQLDADQLLALLCVYVNRVYHDLPRMSALCGTTGNNSFGRALLTLYPVLVPSTSRWPPSTTLSSPL
jgi:hypothetical protein